MTLYSDAAAAITKTREQMQEILDQEAQQARTAHIEALRADLRCNDDSPFAAVANLLAETIQVGRDDGYPAYRIPDDTKTAICAAVEAGILPRRDIRYLDFGCITLYSDCDGVSDKHDLWNADYNAWKAAREYRLKQKTSL